MKRIYQFTLILICSIGYYSCKGPAAKPTPPSPATEKKSTAEPISKPKQDFIAEVTLNNGSKDTISHFNHLLVSHAWSQIITAYPTITKTAFYSVTLDIGPYALEVPFEIIKRIDLKRIKPTNANEYTFGVIELGNGRKLQGSIWANFNGTSDLGEVSFNIEDIKSVEFKQQAKMEYKCPTLGKQKLQLFLIGGETLPIFDASLVKEKVNENGCYLAEETSNTLEFKIPNGGEYTIKGEDIAQIEQIKPKKEFFPGWVVYDAPFKLSLRSGKQYTGSCQTWSVATHGVKGSLRIDDAYALQVAVPFHYNFYQKLVFEQ